MTSYTDNLNLQKYDTGDPANLRDQYNNSMEILDTQVKLVSDVANNAWELSQENEQAIAKEVEDRTEAVQAEATAREQADQELTSKLEQETSAREQADQELTNKLEQETSAREQADSELTSKLETETSAREQADSELTSKLEQETATREQADAELRTELNSAIEVIEKQVIVCIGDSFTATDARDYSWPTKLSKKWEVINVAVGAMGFLYGGTPFNTQLNNAISQVNSRYNNDPNVVKHVIIYGGYNDFRYGETYEDVRTAIRSLYQNAVAAFPLAKVHMVVGNAGWFNRSVQEGYALWTQNLFRGTAVSGGAYNLLNANWWLYGFSNSTVFNDDNLHPNEQGAAMLAKYFEGILNGTFDAGSTWYMTQIQNNETAPSYVHYNAAGDIKFSGCIEGLDTSGTFTIVSDGRFTRDYSQQSICVPWYSGQSITANSVFFNPRTGLLRYTLSSGTANIYF